MWTDRWSRILKKLGWAGRSIAPVFLLLGPLVLFLTTELGRKSIGAPAAEVNSPPAPPLPAAPVQPRVRQQPAHLSAARLTYGLLPIGLLVAVSAFFLSSPGIRALIAPGAGSETVSFEKTMLQPGRFVLDLRNAGHSSVTLTTVNVNESILPFIVKPSPTILPLRTATVYVLYPWVRGEAYTISLLTPDSTTFTTTISSAETTPDSGSQGGVNYLLIGLAAGLFPVLIGITWFPAVTRAGSSLFMFLTALVGGLLAYLGLAIVGEALGLAPQVSALFQGMILVIVGALVTFLALRAFSVYEERDLGAERAWILAAGIGAQNLAEGLAVGAAFSVGVGSLGALFLIGLIAQNVDHGLRLIASTGQERRSAAWLLGLALAGGLPAVLGVWAGGGITSPLLQVLYLSFGVGAVLEAIYAAVQRIRQASPHQPIPPGVYAGFIAGILGLYVASILIS
jgi:zinc transporter ZupT